MPVNSPIILTPSLGEDFRTSSVNQIISGTVEVDTHSVYYKYAIVNPSTGASPSYSNLKTSGITSVTASNSIPEDVLPWSLNISLIGEPILPGYDLYLEFYAINNETEEQSLPSTIKVSFGNFGDNGLSAPIPTGLTIERSSQALIPSCVEVNAESYEGELLGYNFYVSTEPGGGELGYSLMNDEYVKDSSDFQVYRSRLSEGTTVAGDVRITTISDQEAQIPRYSYSLDGETLSRMISSGLLPSGTYDESTTFYFTMTTVLYDHVLAQVVESAYSPEIEGSFVSFAATYNEIPIRNRDQIVVTLMQRMMSLNKQLNLAAGSGFKDLLDPISEEFSDYYIIQDFIAKTESIKGLLAFDDEDADGESDPVDSSLGKSRLRLALKLKNSQAVQDIIDTFFEKKASNFNIKRLGATPSQGKVLYYTNVIPSDGLVISDKSVVSTGSGFNNTGGPVSFVVQGSFFISYEERQTYYNASKKRYEIEVPVIAQNSGSLANVAAGAIVQAVSGSDPRLSVMNAAPMTGGSDKETNLHLANRTQLAIAGVDTGTEGGYALKALGVPGVRSVRVEQGGEPLMRRDIDTSTGRHLGGKVDIYVQSEYPLEVQDTIAFSYDGPAGDGAGERFFIEDALTFRIRTTNSNVTSDTPIFEVIRVFNVSRNKDYDIAGATVGLGDGDSIQLSQNSTNLKIGMFTSDIIKVDYRFRGSNRYVLDNQPVESIVSVTGDIDGVFPSENYSLVKLDDPLKEGNSTISNDGVVIEFFNGFPSNSTKEVSGETHYFLSNVPLKLSKKGIDTDTIVVSADTEGLVPYEKDLDYSVTRGGDKEYTYLNLEPFSKIRSGSLVYISYTCSQNITVVYITNKALQDVQEVINSGKHAAADVIVKGSIKNYVDLSIQVIRKKGTSEVTVTNKIKTLLGNKISNLKVGESLNLDDIITMVKKVEGVKRVVLPFTRMMKKNGSFIPSDNIGKTNFQVYHENSGKGVTSYISVNPVLNYGTIDGGGSPDLFRTIYEGEHSLVMANSPLDVSSSLGKGYIRADGKIIVSTTDGTPPQLKYYKAAYYTYVHPENEYAADITVDKVEHLAVDSTSLEIDASSEEA